MHFKTAKVDFKKAIEIFFCIFFQSTHQIDMKNVIECWKEFFAYSNALETYSRPVNLHSAPTIFVLKTWGRFETLFLKFQTLKKYQADLIN